MMSVTRSPGVLVFPLIEHPATISLLLYMLDAAIIGALKPI